MICMLCCSFVELEFSFPLLSVDKAKLLKWARKYTGRHLKISASSFGCWNCVQDAKMLAEGAYDPSQDWWSNLEKPVNDGNQGNEEKSQPADPSIDTDSENAADSSGSDEEEEYSTSETSLESDLPTIHPCSVVLESLPKRMRLELENTHVVSFGRKEVDKKQEPQHNLILFECKICNKSYKHRHGLRRHLKEKHEDELFACKYCSKDSFETKELLDIHCNYYHLDDIQVAKMKLTCNVCHKVETSAIKFRLHMTYNHPNMRFDCSKCKSKFTTIFKLKVHTCLPRY